MRFVLALWVGLSAVAVSAGQDPLVFRRDVLRITAPPQPIVQTPENPNGAPATPPRAPVEISAEIRSEQALQMNWVHSLSGLQANQGVVILYNPARPIHILPRNVYQPVDILAITPQGAIAQIVPNIALAQLNVAIESGQKIRAQLYLKGGSAEALNIKPGDWVMHPLFTPDPQVFNQRIR